MHIENFLIKRLELIQNKLNHKISKNIKHRINKINKTTNLNFQVFVKKYLKNVAAKKETNKNNNDSYIYK